MSLSFSEPASCTRSGRREPTVENVRSCTGVTENHGGLTPAALANMRLCTAEIAILSGERSLQQHQERGA
jgi:hypothetical protein